MLAATLDEVDDLVTLDLVDHIRLHRCAFHKRGADGGAHHQNLVELNFFASVGGEFLNAEHIARLNPILLAAGLEDRKHLIFLSYPASFGPGFPAFAASRHLEQRALAGRFST